MRYGNVGETRGRQPGELPHLDSDAIAECSGRVAETLALPVAGSSGWTNIISAPAWDDWLKGVNAELVDPGTKDGRTWATVRDVSEVRTERAIGNGAAAPKPVNPQAAPIIPFPNQCRPLTTNCLPRNRNAERGRR